MFYYVTEVQEDAQIQKTAGGKAREDIATILSSDYTPLNIPLDTKSREGGNAFSKIKVHFEVVKKWKEALKVLKSGDTILIQFPCVGHSLFLGKQIKKIKKRGVKIILLIHDLDMLRFTKREDISFAAKLRITLEDKAILKLANKIIVHNKKMIERLASLGYSKDLMVDLEIFDYIIPGYEPNRTKRMADDSVIVAGCLRKHKVGYLYELPENSEYNLYGIDYTGPQNDKIKYHGSFLPDELPAVLQGKFGLVWDGDSSKTCKGAYGAYLRINNPHKTSLYLASGIPVVIWKEAALAQFVQEHNCGIAVDSLDEIGDKIKSLTEEQYMAILENAEKIGKKLREGYYTKKAIKNCDN